MLRAFKQFFDLQSAGGIGLLACTVFALIVANSGYGEAYHAFWNQSFGGISLHHLVNDGLMAIFFLVVGLEIKREILEGELSSPKQAAFPISAALGGMIAPALIYFAFNPSGEHAAGWGIPMATDIAFALGVLKLLGKRVSSSLAVFLTALAIVDDLGAVLVIALFYTSQISWFNLACGTGVLFLLAVLNRLRVRNALTYLAAGVFLWKLFFNSGIHATIAGVMLAVVIPPATGARIEKALHAWVTYAIMPLFALVNAGVGVSTSALFESVSLGIIAGLVVGKQFGITLFSWLGVRMNVAELPDGVSWKQIYGASCLGGIGFTMSLFIANLAFEGTRLLDSAKVGILSASLISGIVGAAVLASNGMRPQEHATIPGNDISP